MSTSNEQMTELNIHMTHLLQRTKDENIALEQKLNQDRQEEIVHRQRLEKELVVLQSETRTLSENHTREVTQKLDEIKNWSRQT